MGGKTISCIITDENMEFMDGSLAVKIIRQIEQKKEMKRMKIITCTCHEDQETSNMIMQSGSDMILSKPLNKSNLMSAMKELNII